MDCRVRYRSRGAIAALACLEGKTCSPLKEIQAKKRPEGDPADKGGWPYLELKGEKHRPGKTANPDCVMIHCHACRWLHGDNFPGRMGALAVHCFTGKPSESAVQPIQTPGVMPGGSSVATHAGIQHWRHSRLISSAFRWRPINTSTDSAGAWACPLCNVTHLYTPCTITASSCC